MFRSPIYKKAFLWVSFLITAVWCGSRYDGAHQHFSQKGFDPATITVLVVLGVPVTGFILYMIIMWIRKQKP